MAAKVDSLKDEMEEALNKVEACKVGVAFNQEVFIFACLLRRKLGQRTTSTLLLKVKGQNCAAWCSAWKRNCVLHPPGPAVCRPVQLCF